MCNWILYEFFYPFSKLGKFIKQMVFSMNFDFFTHLTIWKLNIQLFWELVLNGISKCLYKFCAWSSHLSIFDVYFRSFVYLSKRGGITCKLRVLLWSVNMILSHFPIDYCMFISREINTELYIYHTVHAPHTIFNLWLKLNFSNWKTKTKIGNF